MVLRLVNIMCASEYANLSVIKRKLCWQTKTFLTSSRRVEFSIFMSYCTLFFFKHKNSNRGIVCVMDTWVRLQSVWQSLLCAGPGYPPTPETDIPYFYIFCSWLHLRIVSGKLFKLTLKRQPNEMFSTSSYFHHSNQGLACTDYWFIIFSFLVLFSLRY